MWAAVANMTPDNVLQYLQSSSHSLKESCLWCFKFNILVSCSDLFTVVPTDRGKCDIQAIAYVL